jgi:hypothetical protein
MEPQQTPQGERLQQGRLIAMPQGYVLMFPD